MERFVRPDGISRDYLLGRRDGSLLLNLYTCIGIKNTKFK